MGCSPSLMGCSPAREASGGFIGDAGVSARGSGFRSHIGNLRRNSCFPRDPRALNGVRARLPKLDEVRHWMLPSHGAHGLDIDHQQHLLYVACDGGALVEVEAFAGDVRREWPLAGVPDATFFNPASGLVHVAIDDPGLVQSIDPRTGASTELATATGAQTTALVAPDCLYVFSPSHGGSVVLKES